ncbi:cytochrome P450 monooxygenase [Pleurotus pulmonarius]
MANSSLSILLPLLGVTFWLVLRRKRVNRLYPPGPPSWPIIGNLFRLPAKHPWISFTQWKETYGSMLYFRGLGVSILVLNDVKLVTELFEKRPGIYSNRPRFTVAGDLLGIDESMPLRLHDRGWKLQRKLARTAMSPDAVKQYHPLLEDIAALLSESLRETPEAFGVHIRLAVSRVVLSVTYGIPVATVDNEYVVLVEEAAKVISKATNPGAHLADLFPILKGTHALLFRNDIQRDRRIVQDSVDKPFNHVKKQIAESRTLPSLAHNLLANEGGKEFTTRREYEDAVKWLTGSLYLAGVESTTALVSTTLLALAMNPDKQERAQKEIDDVIGSNRLPTLDDKDSLPYVGALIKESMRWHPPIPLSLGRQTSHDDICEGYFIPAGTIVLPNIWAIARDGGGKYPSEEFVPERFLDVDPPKDPSSYAFGCGRRICPAIQFVERSTFIFVASILAAFNTCPKVDNNGNPIPYDAQFSSSLVSFPEDFKCNIKPRSTERSVQVLDRAAAVASYIT